ncbi:MAG TPA: complex I subunit 1 family protein [Terriglobales bacterium]|nr:complex I subunit 1 family protein [Terriglobales bacterium]
MGVVLSATAVLSALLISALLTARMESWACRRARYEMGPAAQVPIGQDLLPQSADSWLYRLGPLLALLGVSWAMVVIPFSAHWVGSNLNIGLFYFLVVVDYVALSIAVGGWGANTPASVEACYRGVAQLVAYVIPLGLAVIGPIMMARSLSTVSIIWAQQKAGLWYIVVQPHEFALYIATALMQSYRAPFLDPFADSIQGGVLGVYGGWKAATWRVSLASLFFIVAATGAVLFLGGYDGPWLPGPVWLIVKTAAVMILMIWVGRRVRAFSTAEMLSLAWKVLIPIGLLNVLIVGAEILAGIGQSPFR